MAVARLEKGVICLFLICFDFISISFVFFYVLFGSGVDRVEKCEKKKKLGGVEEISFLFAKLSRLESKLSSHLTSGTFGWGSLNFVFVHFGEFTSSFSFLPSY